MYLADPSGRKKTEPLVEIKQTPYCVCGNKGHTWFSCELCATWGVLHCPIDYLMDPETQHRCQDDPRYINNLWEVHIPDSADNWEFQDCLQDYLYWEFDPGCPRYTFWGGCTCRHYIEEALQHCDGWKVLVYVN